MTTEYSLVYNQGLTLTPANLPNVGGFQLWRVTQSLPLATLGFYPFTYRVSVKWGVSAPFGETGPAHEQHTSFLSFYYTTLNSLCCWVIKRRTAVAPSHGSDWRQAAQGKCALMPVHSGHGDVNVKWRYCRWSNTFYLAVLLFQNSLFSVSSVTQTPVFQLSLISRVSQTVAVNLLLLLL